MVSLAAAALLVGAASAASGCGGPHPRPAALRLERADLVLVAATLRRLEPTVSGEVAAARVVWPALAAGLPTSLAPAQRSALAIAERRARALALPWYVTTEEGGGLTGPAVTVGRLLKGYATLTPRGWRFIAAALAAQAAASGRERAPAQGQTTSAQGKATSAQGKATSAQGQTTSAQSKAAATAQFMRANAGLYIYSVYDGHYDLSLVGKSLSEAYRKLGGPSAFGHSLTQSEVHVLTLAYSIPETRLQPHPPAGLAV